MKIKEELFKDDFYNIDDEQSAQSFLERKASESKTELNDEEFAKLMDEQDPLAPIRREFCYPRTENLPNVDKTLTGSNSSECIYLCGQSLGLMPVETTKFMQEFLNDWATLGVYGHFVGSNPWAKCDSPCISTMSELVGAEQREVAVMNSLSVNLHLMMTRFYQPTKDRYKILYEDHAFPSDQYAIHSQLKLRGYDTEKSKIVLKSRENENYHRTEDIIDLLRREGHSIALVMLGGIHYYTGQFFDIEQITRVAHEQGCCVGWDLAHAIGNVPLKLHDWNVDFAAWCTYKYLNSGAGCIGGIFVHSNHLTSCSPPSSLDGWWGNRESTRFAMFDNIDRENESANGFRVSNPSIHQCAALAASLKIFEKVGIERIRAKSVVLTQYLQHLLETEIKESCEYSLLTPTNQKERGAQLSFRPHRFSAQQIHDELEKFGVVIDIRDDVIRIAPVSLYNSFLDVYRFVRLLKQTIFQLNQSLN